MDEPPPFTKWRIDWPKYFHWHITSLEGFFQQPTGGRFANAVRTFYSNQQMFFHTLPLYLVQAGM
jgi:hypothetical protein